MKVLVVAISQPSGMSGVQRHAFNLVHSLLQLPEIDALHLVLAPWQSHLPAIAGLESGSRLRIVLTDMPRGSVARNIWHLRGLPKLAHEVQADLVQLTYPVPFLSAAFPCPVVMTLHDLYPFEIPGNFGFPQVLVNQLILRLALRQADAIASVSRTTLQALQTFAPDPAARSIVIPNCVEPGPPVSGCGPLAAWNGEPFLLTVAQHRRNKNIDLILSSFRRLLASRVLPHIAKLVVVGMPGPESPRLHALTQALELSSSVAFLEGLSDSELQWCYRHCAALVMPSSIEGFGLPVVEARLAGCRVVCSDIPALRELAGPQVHFVELNDDVELNLARAIKEAMGSPRPAPESLPQFARETIAQAYLKLYRTQARTRMADVRLRQSSSQVENRQIL